MTPKLDLLLVTPPSKNIAFQDLSKNFVAIEPPVWSTLLATFLRRKGVAVEILDAEAESIGYDETARRISEIDAILTVFVIYGHQPSGLHPMHACWKSRCGESARMDSQPENVSDGYSCFGPAKAHPYRRTL